MHLLTSRKLSWLLRVNAASKPYPGVDQHLLQNRGTLTRSMASEIALFGAGANGGFQEEPEYFTNG